MRHAVTVVLCLCLCSCASILQSGPDPVGISSDPIEASVFLDGLQVGKTPVQLVVKRSARGIVRLEKEGYHPVQYRLPTSVNGTTFLNLFLGLIGAPLGFLIDGVSGNISAWHSPNSVTLTPKSEDEPTESEVKQMVNPRKKSPKSETQS